MDSTDQLLIVAALLKPGTTRSYEDILLIKSYVSTLDLIKSKFSTIRSEQLDYLCRAINIESFPPKVCIFQRGMFADKMYIVFSGCCSIIDSSSVGDKESSNECFSGMSFGEDAILANKHRTSSAYNDSASVTELLSIDRASYLAFLADAYDANNHPSSSSSAKGSLIYVMGILEKPRHIRTAADIESMAAYFAREMYVTLQSIMNSIIIIAPQHYLISGEIGELLHCKIITHEN
jgi:Cyclic nucleotide-binding domain